MAHRLSWPWIFLIPMLCAGCRTAPIPEPVKLSVFGTGLETGAQLREDALAEFTAKTGIQVDLIPTLGSSTEQLRVAKRLLQKGSGGPDVYLIDMIWPGTLQEYLLDLTPYLNEDARKHLPALAENDTIGKRVLALPFYMNAGVLYYRRDLLTKNGYSAPPRSWQELRQMALKIQQTERREGKKQFWGYVWQGGAYEGLTCNALEWQRSFGGGNLLESDGTVSVNNPRTADALKMATSWIGGISPESVLSYNESDTLNVFQSGNAGFMRHWSSAFRNIRGVVTGSVGIAPIPVGPAGRAQGIGGFHLGVSRRCTHPREAAELVLWLTGPEVQRRRALRRGYVPTRPDLQIDPELVKGLPQLTVLNHSGNQDWAVRPSTIAGDRYGEVSRVYYEAIHKVLLREAQVLPALADLEQELNRLAGDRGFGRN